MRVPRTFRTVGALGAVTVFITTGGAIGSVIHGSAASADPFTVTSRLNLNIRSGPGIEHGIVGRLAPGSALESTGPAQNGWLPIEHGGSGGWVSDVYVQGTGASAPSTPPSTSPKPADPAAPVARGTAQTTARLNVRTGPGVRFQVVTVLDRGAAVTTTGETENSYSQINHQGQQRWVATRYLTASGSGSGGGAGNESESGSGSDSGSGAGTSAPSGTATATAPLLIRTTSGAVFETVATVPAGTTLQLTGVTENGRTQVTYNGELRWVNSAYLSGTSNVPKPDTPQTVATLYGTTALILRSSPDENFVDHGDAPAGTAFQMTGRVANGRAEVVHNGEIRWVTAQYLSDTRPSATSSRAPATLPGITPATQNILTQVRTNFPEVRVIGGKRNQPGSDHHTGRALDVMTYTDMALGNRIAKWAQDNAVALEIDYIIWDQHIWSVARQREGWRFMADRGSPTQNHKDHVHISVRR